MYLLDTNVVSELRKVRTGKANANVANWADTVDASHMFVSVITLQELEVGVLRSERKDPRKGAVLRRWLNEHVLPAFSERVLPVDTHVALRSAALHVPTPRPARDALIAATALVHGMPVVTRNVSDFAPCGVDVVDPWQP
jgi:predicted nucleic acid-binding protein